MNTIVVYCSKYGSTEKYAHWIAEELGCSAKKLSEVQAESLARYDTIVYGGGLYAGTIAGFKKFLSKLGKTNGKKLLLYMVGLTNPEEEDIYLETAEKNIPQQWKGKFQIFAFQGDQQFGKMSALHKLMMRMPKSMAQKKPPEERTAQEQKFIDNFGKDIFFADRAYLAPLVNYIKSTE